MELEWGCEGVGYGEMSLVLVAGGPESMGEWYRVCMGRYYSLGDWLWNLLRCWTSGQGNCHEQSESTGLREPGCRGFFDDDDLSFWGSIGARVVDAYGGEDSGGAFADEPQAEWRTLFPALSAGDGMCGDWEWVCGVER